MLLPCFEKTVGEKYQRVAGLHTFIMVHAKFTMMYVLFLSPFMSLLLIDSIDPNLT